MASMVCPHCRVKMAISYRTSCLGSGSDFRHPCWACPNCHLLIERKHIHNQWHYRSASGQFWLPENGHRSRLIPVNDTPEHRAYLASYRVDWDEVLDEDAECPMHGRDCPWLPASRERERESDGVTLWV